MDEDQGHTRSSSSNVAWDLMCVTVIANYMICPNDEE